MGEKKGFVVIIYFINILLILYIYYTIIYI